VLSASEETQFWMIHSKTAPDLYRKAYRMCGGHIADAEDALQCTYLKALVHWTTVSRLDNSQCKAWLARTLTNEVLQIWRAKHRSHETGSYEDAAGLLGTVSDAGSLPDKSNFHAACRAIAILGGREGEVMALHCLAGYEISEVAEILGIRAGTARVELHRGRERVRKMLAREEGDADGHA
jgi:RNA polymerase sigma factor (sigma-70 family)